MKPYIENVIEINASSIQVWDALVNPQKTKIYMFGCETVSDWKQGSTLLWKGHYNGQEIIFVTGHIVDIQPYKALTYSVFDPNSLMENIPANYLNVSYQLKENNATTTLTVTQGNYTEVADGERRYAEAYNNGEGWNPILVQIKNLVEGN